MEELAYKKSLFYVNLFLKSSLVLVAFLIIILYFNPFLILLIITTYMLFLLILFSIICIVVGAVDYKKSRNRLNIVVIGIFSLILLLLAGVCAIEADATIKEVPAVESSDNVLSSKQIFDALNYPQNYRGYKIDIRGKVKEIHTSGMNWMLNPVIWSLIYGKTTWFEISTTDEYGNERSILVYSRSKNKNVALNNYVTIKGYVLGQYLRNKIFFPSDIYLFVEAEKVDLYQQEKLVN